MTVVQMMSIVLGVSGGCGATDVAPGSAEQAIVYGQDDRRELYQTEGPVAQLARERAVALISAQHLVRLADGDYQVEATSHGEQQMLCAGEPFADQVAAASCSGVLVGPDLVVTAGHCLGVSVDGNRDCATSHYVLGYSMSTPALEVRLAARNVFTCAEVVALARSAPDAGCHVDLALVRLDRRAADRELALRDHPVQAGEVLTVLGFPAGLPLKIDQAARVVDARNELGDAFTLSSDTFAASSGSGVFDTEGALVGVFARGRVDYEAHGQCQRVHREPEYEAIDYEQATHVAVLRRLLEAARRGEQPAVSDLLENPLACRTPDAGAPDAGGRWIEEGARDASPDAGRDDPSALRPQGDGGASAHGDIRAADAVGCAVGLRGAARGVKPGLVVLVALLARLSTRRRDV